MNNSLKGSLVVRFDISRLGQVALKHYKRGAVIMLTVVVSMAAVTVKAAQLALAILEKIELEGGIISVNTILNAAPGITDSGNLTFISLFY